jgi:malate dehydrogenase (oxaloacetate-decarboxylating)
LDVRTRTITDEMCLAAAEALALAGEEKGLDDDHIVPDMQEEGLYPREAAAVGLKAIEQGLARVTYTGEELYAMADERIRNARAMVNAMMDEGVIAPAPAAE